MLSVQWVAEMLVATKCVRLCSGEQRGGVWERALLWDGTTGKGMWVCDYERGDMMLGGVER